MSLCNSICINAVTLLSFLEPALLYNLFSLNMWNVWFRDFGCTWIKLLTWLHQQSMQTGSNVLIHKNCYFFFNQYCLISGNHFYKKGVSYLIPIIRYNTLYNIQYVKYIMFICYFSLYRENITSLRKSLSFSSLVILNELPNCNYFDSLCILDGLNTEHNRWVHFIHNISCHWWLPYFSWHCQSHTSSIKVFLYKFPQNKHTLSVSVQSEVSLN